jgi:hypothetical protein
MEMASTTDFDSFTRSNQDTTIQFSSHPEVVRHLLFL